MSKIIAAFEKEVKQTDKDISTLREQKKGLVIDVSTDSGFKEARKERTEMNKSLTVIDDVAKKGKRDIDVKREEFKDVVRVIYQPIVSQFEIEEQRRKDVKKEEEIKEAARVKAILDQINGIRQFSLNLQGKTSEEVSDIIEAVNMIDVSENFAEHTQEAMQAKSETLGELNINLSSKIQNEKLEQDRLALAEEKKVNDEKIRLADLKQKAQERLMNLQLIPSKMYGQTSKQIKAKISSLGNFEIKEDEFGELTEQAHVEVGNVCGQLKQILDNVLLVEEAKADKKLMQEEIANQQESNVTQEEKSEIVKSFDDAISTGTGNMLDGKRIDPTDIYKTPAINQEKLTPTIEDVRLFIFTALNENQPPHSNLMECFGYLFLCEDSILIKEASNKLRSEFKNFFSSK